MGDIVVTTVLTEDSFVNQNGTGKIADVLYNLESNRYAVRCYKDNVLVKVITDPTWILEDAAFDAAEAYINED
jgi:hypothetical protein